MATVGDVIVEAQSVFLNDAGGGIYPSSALLPIVKKAVRDMQSELQSNQATEIKEVTGVIAVPINATVLNNVAGYPADVLDPIALFEKPTGASNDQYVPMTQLAWEPDITPDAMIKFWDYRELEIKINPATRTNDVKMRYYKVLIPIVDVNSLITIPESFGYLSARTAAIAAANIGENQTRALICQDEAMIRLSKMINVMVKQNQSIPVRRRRFRPFR